ncbi:hypothetical protein CQW23_17604 [Capsicum baccatum]|uniref:F-box domain-containing protein n=1 Tax=Capsicum baccatum TaxID=33114 RepID=A0A2G2WEH4_CAPBA|nr:hypothetical protein CQW23_17604 [Capsicum baccatum]
MSDYLPKELMIYIFTRLPIKSILRCTRVCRSWYSLINSPNFISTHLNQSTDDYILIQPYSIVPKVEIYALFHKNENLDQDIQFDFPFDCSSCYFIIVGSCNGILCFATANMLRDWNNFYFWNPSIRKSVKLPVPGYTCGKLIHLVIYVNGASLWIAFKWNEISHQGMIVLLDMHDETFPEMMLPSSLTNESRSNYDELFLFVSEESLCMVDNNYDKSKPIDIWMMRVYGAPDSWVKQFSIKYYHVVGNMPLHDHIFWTPYSVSSGPNELEIANDFIKPVSMRKNGEILWEANHRKKLFVSVDDVVEKSKDVDLGKSTSDWYHNPHYVTFYKKSLVLPVKWESNCVGDACEQSSGLCKREPKVGRRRLLSAKTKSRMGVASLLHMRGLLYVSKMKGKWLRKNGRKSMQVKKPSLSN